MSLALSAVGARVDNADNTAFVNEWLLAIATPPGHKGLVDGLYRCGPLSPPQGCHAITIEGEQATIDAGFGCGLQYVGPPGGTLLPLVGVGRFVARDVGFYGSGLAGLLIGCVDGVVPPYQWVLDNTVLNGVADNGTLFQVGSRTNCGTFQFNNVQWYGNPQRSAKGFASTNPNCVANSFRGGSIGGCSTAIWLDSGAADIQGLAFAGNSQQDIWLNHCNEVCVRGCWSEESNRFLYMPFGGNGVEAALDIASCTLSSTPFSYWKTQGASEPNLADPASYAPIIVNRQRGLVMRNVGLYYPVPGAQQQNCILNQNYAAADWDISQCRAQLPGGAITRKVISLQGTIQ